MGEGKALGYKIAGFDKKLKFCFLHRLLSILRSAIEGLLPQCIPGKVTRRFKSGTRQLRVPAIVY